MEFHLFKAEFYGVTLNIDLSTLFGHIDCSQFEFDMNNAM